MKIRILFCISAFLLLFGCAHRVTTKSEYDFQKYPDIGYVAFKFEPVPRSFLGALAGDCGRYDLSIEEISSKESYLFMLNDEKPSSVNFYIGPFKVYQTMFEKEQIPPLKLLPLPQGTYKLKYIYKKDYRSSRAWATKDEEFVIQKDKMTYIGTFSIQPKYFLFYPYGLAIEAKDDGSERADSMGIKEQLMKSLCRIKD